MDRVRKLTGAEPLLTKGFTGSAGETVYARNFQLMGHQ